MERRMDEFYIKKKRVQMRAANLETGMLKKKGWLLEET